MDISEKKVKDLIPYENNPRLNDDAVEYVMQSIESFGFKVPLVIDKDNVIVCGHTRWKAAQRLGMKTVPCVVADDLTPEQIKAYRIADNKVTDFSLWDNKKLLEELNEIAELDPDLFTGFDIGEMFNDVLDETDNTPLAENNYGNVYEITFKSEDKSKIDEISRLWKELSEDEEE